jgi:lipoprotein-anchoring transpeptidase ErfK/SrfK
MNWRHKIIPASLAIIAAVLIMIYGAWARSNPAGSYKPVSQKQAVEPQAPVPVELPRVAKFYPSNGAQGTVLDIEDPMVVDFNKSTLGFFVKFELNPAVEVAYRNNLEKTQFKLLPKYQPAEGQKYDVKIYAKKLDDPDENYKEIYASSFETLSPKPQVWDKNFSVRIEQAKSYTRAKIFEGKYIDINLSAQVLSIFQDGKLLDSFLVSTGKRGMETPKGTFAIANKTPRAWSQAYGLFMPYWMAILPSGKVGIHELPEWPGGYKEGANHLGIPVSHGCVRLGVGPAKRVYNWAEIGTPVVVY